MSGLLDVRSVSGYVDTMTDFNQLTTQRAEALDTLIVTSQGIAQADDYGDMIGAVRLVELAAQQARKAVIVEARAAGEPWQNIADALGVSRQAAWERYGRATEQPNPADLAQ